MFNHDTKISLFTLNCVLFANYLSKYVVEGQAETMSDSREERKKVDEGSKDRDDITQPSFLHLSPKSYMHTVIELRKMTVERDHTAAQLTALKRTISSDWADSNPDSPEEQVTFHPKVTDRTTSNPTIQSSWYLCLVVRKPHG